MNEYVCYVDLDEYQSLDAGKPKDVALLRRFCEVASRMFDGSARRVFYPRSETRYYDYPPKASVLTVDDDLLEVTTFTTQNAGVTLSATDYYLMCGGSYNLMPYNRIVMRDDQSYPVLLYTGSLQKSQAVTGTWGYHEDWSNAWESSGDTVQDDPLSSSATAITVSDVDGADRYGFTPRFKVQQLLKLESEYVYVTNIVEPTNKLTVVRGVNGTTAAAHDAATAISIYRPMNDVAHAVKRLAAWLYAQRDVPFTKTIQVVPGMGTTIKIPPGAPDEVLATAARYTRG